MLKYIDKFTSMYIVHMRYTYNGSTRDRDERYNVVGCWIVMYEVVSTLYSCSGRLLPVIAMSIMTVMVIGDTTMSNCDHFIKIGIFACLFVCLFVCVAARVQDMLMMMMETVLFA